MYGSPELQSGAACPHAAGMRWSQAGKQLAWREQITSTQAMCGVQEDAQDIVELMQACMLDETGLQIDPTNFGGRPRKGKQVLSQPPKLSGLMYTARAQPSAMHDVLLSEALGILQATHPSWCIACTHTHQHASQTPPLVKPADQYLSLCICSNAGDMLSCRVGYQPHAYPT